MESLQTFKGYDGIFARRLFMLMQKNKTKQTELAEHLGLTRQAISKYISGVALPDIENVRKICEYYNVSSDYLLGLTEYDNIVIDERLCSEITGLNNNSIKLLRSIVNKKGKDTENVLMLLNLTLSNEGSLLQLSDYITKCYDNYKNLGKRSTEYRMSVMLFSDWFDDLIDDIIDIVDKENMTKSGGKNGKKSK